MVKDLIGYRFSPTGEELVNYYLKNKNLGSNTWLVDEAIREINILSHEPEFLPSLAKIQSDDLNWYFFSRIEYTNAKKNAMKRSTGSGFWKPTGKDRIIRDKNGVEIGLKKTLVYHKGKAPNGRTPWVMHEYHITCLPHHQRTYVICQVMKKDKDGNIRSGGNYSSEPSPPLFTAPEFQVEQQTGQYNYNGLPENDLRSPWNELEDLSEWDRRFDPGMFINDDVSGGLRHVERGQVENLCANEDIPSGGNYWSEPSQPLVSDSNTTRAMINITPEFEQPGPENLYGLSVDDLMIPRNQLGCGQFEISLRISRRTKMSFSDNNNPTVQPQAPHLDPDEDEYLCAIEESSSGIIVGYSSDSDINDESISALSYHRTSSPGDSVGSPNKLQDEQSLKDTLAVYRTAAEAAARIQGAVREKALKAALSSVIQFANKEEEAKSIIAAMKIQNAFRKYDTRRKIEAAYQIQCRFQTWIMRKEYLNMGRQAISVGSQNMLQDEQSLKDALAAYRTAAEAAARIHGAFREKSLKAARSSVIQFANKEEEAKSIIAAMKIQNAFRKYDTRRKIEAAYRIQCRFQTWKMRREYLNMRRQAIRIQAAFRGLQVRRQYKKIVWSVEVLEKAVLSWRQKRKGFRGLRMIIGFILLLALIGKIISALLTFKA